MTSSCWLPLDVVAIILEYDGRIKYLHNQGIFINIIHKHDMRYTTITPIINKKIRIIENLMRSVYNGISSFYFEFGFDIDNRVGLCYDYNFSYANKFEICYYDMRNEWIQIRTYV
jgi:hypothetical protein